MGTLFIQKLEKYAVENLVALPYVNEEISKFFTVINKEKSDYVLWLNIDKDYLGFNFLLGCVYIHPDSSPYSTVESFECIEDDILNLGNGSMVPVCLVVDFNARSAARSDFINYDDYVLIHILDNDDTIKQFMQDDNCLDKLGFDVTRYSLGKETNAYGRRLTDMCKSTNIHIADGRIGLDRETGKLTCKNASLVDYVIKSPQIFPYVKTFLVEDFNMNFTLHKINV